MTWVANKIHAGEAEYNYDGTLDIGGLDWSESEAPDSFSCVHHKGDDDANLASIIERFVARQNDFIDRIHAVEFSRFFSRNLNGQFAVVMPALEGDVQDRYKTGEEKSYIEWEAEFFKWVEASPTEAVREFSKKHVKVQKRKAPGLKTLLSRAIAAVNEKGFCFEPGLAGRIQDRRGRLFHAAPLLSEGEVLSFFGEVKAITVLLLLHTLMDFGIDIAKLARRHFALPDMRALMRSPTTNTEGSAAAAPEPNPLDKCGHP